MNESTLIDCLVQRANLLAEAEVFGCDFSQVYGLTEVSGVVTTPTPEDHRRGAARRGAALLRSAGRPLPRTALRIVDPVTLADMPDVRVGEVWIRSGRNFMACWKKPEATLEACPQGRDAEGGWFRSGDENIYPAVVENTLMKHPDGADGAVIGVPHTVSGKLLKRDLRAPYRAGHVRSIH